VVSHLPGGMPLRSCPTKVYLVKYKVYKMSTTLVLIFMLIQSLVSYTLQSTFSQAFIFAQFTITSSSSSYIMAAAVADYSHDHFHSLLDLNSAHDNFLKLGGLKLVEDVFKDFFITNGMDCTFGLAMLHCYFDILPRQMIVNYNGTSIAWNANLGEKMDQP